MAAMLSVSDRPWSARHKNGLGMTRWNVRFGHTHIGSAPFLGRRPQNAGPKLFERGKPFGTRRPDCARTPTHSVSSLHDSVKVRPALSIQRQAVGLLEHARVGQRASLTSAG